jgi:DeoR/GlpR family transcriptional regulator of sugar metabolism
MFPAERINKIKEILIKTKQIDIASLSDALKVTEVTVRRDLEKLENENFLIRTHGGAILNDESSLPERPSFLDEDPETEKIRDTIGQIASLFVKDNDIVFLSHGAVNRHIGKSLKGKKNVTVVTNDLAVIFYTAMYAPETRVICPGGELNTGDLQFTGRNTEVAIKDMHYTLAFIDIDGVSMERGYTVSSINKSYMVQDVMLVSDKSLAVCDYRNFNTNSFVSLGKLNMFKSVISNEQTPEQFKEYYYENNIQFFSTFDIYRR